MRDQGIHHTTSRSQQRGQVLFVILAIIVLGGVAGFVAYMGRTTNAPDRRTAAALADAKAALIGYAAGCPDNVDPTTLAHYSWCGPSFGQARPGQLPCPDADDDGVADPFVGGQCPSYVGRLPWQTLGLPDPRDDSGERLWYAVSENFARDPSCGSSCPLNSDTTGQLTITGSGPATNVVAIIFAPGGVRGTQVRDPANKNNVVNYLEGENSNGDTTYTAANTSDTFNDKLISITGDALFYVVARAVARFAQNALEAYRAANNYYPYASDYSATAPYYCSEGLYDGRIPMVIRGSVGPPAVGCNSQAEWAGQLPPWFSTNRWNLVTHYGVARLCTVSGVSERTFCENYGGDPTGASFPGNPPLTVTGFTTVGRTVVIVTGPAVSAQSHPCSTAAQCLEDTENSNGDRIYTKPSRLPASNDRMAVTCALAAPCPAVP